MSPLTALLAGRPRRSKRVQFSFLLFLALDLWRWNDAIRSITISTLFHSNLFSNAHNFKAPAPRAVAATHFTKHLKHDFSIVSLKSHSTNIWSRILLILYVSPWMWFTWRPKSAITKFDCLSQNVQRSGEKKKKAVETPTFQKRIRNMRCAWVWRRRGKKTFKTNLKYEHD